MRLISCRQNGCRAHARGIKSTDRRNPKLYQWSLQRWIWYHYNILYHEKSHTVRMALLFVGSIFPYHTNRIIVNWARVLLKDTIETHWMQNAFRDFSRCPAEETNLISQWCEQFLWCLLTCPTGYTTLLRRWINVNDLIQRRNKIVCPVDIID